MREDDCVAIGKPVLRLRLRRGAGLGGATLRSAGWQAWSRLRHGVGAGGSDVEEHWDVLGSWRDHSTHPRGEPGMTLRRARCPRTEGAGCVLRAIRTESGDTRCDGQEDRRGHDACHTSRAASCDWTAVCTTAMWTGHYPG